MQPKFLKTLLICGLITGLAVPAFTAEDKSSATVEKAAVTEEVKPVVAAAEAPKAEPPKEEMARKTMTGEVAGISPSFIAVIYDKDDKSAYEMALNLDPKVKIVGKKNISEIHVGDTVTVSYDERFQKDEKGDTRINGRKVTAVSFVREGKKLMEEGLPVTPPVEEEAQEGAQEE